MRVGVIGTGNMGREHLRALAECGIMNPVVCSVDENAAKELANKYEGIAYTDYKEMLEKEKLDFVTVCVPTPSHYEIAVNVMKKGVSVLCEKPFASNCEQADEMVRIAKENNVVLMVGHCVRFDKAYIYLKNILADNRFGRILSLSMYRHSSIPRWSANGWMNNFEVSGGAVLDLHIHETDIITYLLGKPESVTTLGDYCHCSTLYNFGNGVNVDAQASWRPMDVYSFRSGYDACFEKATIIYKDKKMQVVLKDGTTLDNEIANEKFADYIISDNAYDCEMRYFIDSVKAKRQEYCKPETSLQSLKITFAEIESIKQNGKTIELN